MNSKMILAIIAGSSVVVAAILKPRSVPSNPVDDGVITWLDGYDVTIQRADATGFTINVKGVAKDSKGVVKDTLWSEIEFIMAYRTNKIPDSPLRIDFWSPDGTAVPLKSTMRGWSEFLEKLPSCIALENYGMLQTVPFTQNVMKGAVFTLLYDTQGRDMMDVYNKHYKG